MSSMMKNLKGWDNLTLMLISMILTLISCTTGRITRQRKVSCISTNKNGTRTSGILHQQVTLEAIVGLLVVNTLKVGNLY